MITWNKNMEEKQNYVAWMQTALFQLAHDVRDILWRLPKGPNIRGLHGTFKGLSGDQHKNWWYNKKLFFRCNSPCITHLFLFFLQKEQIFKSFKWTSLRPSCGKSRGPNNGTFCGRPRGVSDICFLDSTHKHIKLTLIGYSRFYSEWQ